MRLRKAIKLLICRFKGHIRAGWIYRRKLNGRKIPIIYYRCERCGRIV
jgi:hypothetical protein